MGLKFLSFLAGGVEELDVREVVEYLRQEVSEKVMLEIEGLSDEDLRCLLVSMAERVREILRIMGEDAVISLEGQVKTSVLELQKKADYLVYVDMMHGQGYADSRILDYVSFSTRRGWRCRPWYNFRILLEKGIKVGTVVFEPNAKNGRPFEVTKIASNCTVCGGGRAGKGPEHLEVWQGGMQEVG